MGVDVSVSQLIALVLGLSGCRVGQSASFALCSPVQGELSDIVVTSSPYAVRNKGQDWFSCSQGQLSHTYTSKASSPVLPR